MNLRLRPKTKDPVKVRLSIPRSQKRLAFHFSGMCSVRNQQGRLIHQFQTAFEPAYNSQYIPTRPGARIQRLLADTIARVSPLTLCSWTCRGKAEAITLTV